MVLKSENDFKISVIVPVYNGEKYLEQTLNSILCSSEKSLQIVIVDDGSKDNGSVICKKFQEKYDNIIYFQKENEGIVSARNKGLELATGEYICFCDQDDLIEKDCYGKMLLKLESENCDSVLCGTARYINENDIIPLEIFEDKIWEGEEIKDELINPVLFYGSDLGKSPVERRVGTIWKCMVKKKLIHENNIKFEKYVDYEDDLLFFLDVMMHSNKVAMLSDVGYFWRVNLKSETYNWKYNSDFCSKYKLYINAVINKMKKINYSNEDIENYRKYQMCTMYDNYMINEGSRLNKKTYFEKKKVIKRDIVNQEEFVQCISFRKHINKTSIRKRVSLTLLAHGFIGASYLFAVEYKKLREKAINCKQWFLIENLIKQYAK